MSNHLNISIVSVANLPVSGIAVSIRTALFASMENVCPSVCFAVY